MSAVGERHLGIYPAAGAPVEPEPPPRFFLYLAYGYPPPGTKTILMHLVDWLFGAQLWLLYVGITFRTGPVRWAEHEGRGLGLYLKVPKAWARYTKLHELLDERSFATLKEAEAAEALLIRRLQPLGCIAHRGQRGGPRVETLRRRHAPRRAVVQRLQIGVPLGLLIFLTLAWPRLITGEFPTGWGWLAWAVFSAAVMGARRREP